MVTKKKEPVTWKAGWNGKAYEGSDWMIANSLIPSRRLTKKEVTDMANKMEEFAKKKGLNMKVTIKKG
jgi:hypothetical protein